MTREEALQWLTNEKWKNANNKYKKEWNEAFDMAIEALANLKEEFESAVPNCQKCAIKELWQETEKENLVEVVRCKDCRHSYFKDFDKYCPYMVSALKPDGYCSHGERRK